MVINISVLPREFIQRKINQMTIDTQSLQKGVYYAFKFDKLHGFIKVNDDDTINFKMLSWRHRIKFRKIFRQIEG